nr:RNA-dependent RNA polymerase [Ustilaginoidea virens botourmiavirus virus 9]
MMVSSGESPAFTTAVRDALLTIQEVSQALEAHVGLSDGSLPVPGELLEHPSLSTAKQFCVGLLENPDNHVWTPVLSRCSLEQRFSVAGSLFLCRKMLPCHPSSWEDHRDRLTTGPVAELPRGYLSFARKVARSQLRGWDRKYDRFVSSFSPPTSATTSTPRSKGGARAEWLGARKDFILACLGKDPSVYRRILPTEFVARFQNVQLDGKSRSVTIADGVQHLLGPLHRCLYDSVSGKDWLLRGEAKTGKFRDFVSVPGEVFVSGDYESATDYLPLEVAVVILEAARAESSSVPDVVWELAFDSLHAFVEYPDGSRHAMVRGQLMGNLLSFPLLCLQNYIAWRWCFKGAWKSIPVRINGDDIVFRTSRARYQQWAGTVRQLGLRLSLGKTLVHGSVFSLNSTFFRALRRGQPVLIPVVRAAVLSRPCEVPHSIGAGLATFARGFVGESRVRLEVLYLRRRSRHVTACGRSVLRDLRVPASPEAIRRLGWMKREAFFLSLPPCPLPVDFTRLGLTSLPSGWWREPLSGERARRRRQRQAEEGFYSLLVSRAWEECVPYKVLSRLVWDRTRSSGRLVSWRWWRRNQRGRRGWRVRGRFHVPSCPRVYREFSSLLRLSVDPVWSFVPPPRERRVWCGGVGVSRVRFVPASLESIPCSVV